MDNEKTYPVEAAPPVFEQGPIRPPSEARSLLLRVTRNCPWNKCEFCPVYKGAKFSRRTVEEVKSDIRAMAWWMERAVEESWRLGFGGRLDNHSLPAVYRPNATNPYLSSILTWMSGGGKTAFIQDANSLLIKPGDLAEILRFFREIFPGLERVTSYARSQTLARMSLPDANAIREAGLDRVHIGLESGSDAVLKDVKKGATADIHIKAGRNAKDAGFELSEYVMPGLGGKKLWKENALETARVLNAIDPDFIRFRSLGVKEGIILYDRMQNGEFEPMNDELIAQELKLMIENLEGISSYLVSDHILNLLPEVEGRLPEDKEKIIGVIDKFLALDDDARITYVVGRRFGLFETLSDLHDPVQSAAAKRALVRLREQGGGDIHNTIREIISRFI